MSLPKDVDGVPLQATLQLRDGADPDLAGLYEPMLARETNRRLGTPRPIPADTIELLHAVAEREGARLHLVTEPDEIAGAATIFAAADRIRYLTPKLHAEMISELRWPGDPYPDTGIDVRSLELEPGEPRRAGHLEAPGRHGPPGSVECGNRFGRGHSPSRGGEFCLGGHFGAGGTLDRLRARRICR